MTYHLLTISTLCLKGVCDRPTTGETLAQGSEDSSDVIAPFGLFSFNTGRNLYTRGTHATRMSA